MPFKPELQNEIDNLRAMLAAETLRRRKREATARALENPAGVTRAELIAAYGFPTISVKTQAKHLGMAVRFEMDNGHKRYFRAAACLGADAGIGAVENAAENDQAPKEKLDA